MKAIIYHNPNCGTSRKTLEILNNEGADVTVIQYMQTPPSREELKRIFDRAGMSARDGLRAKEQIAKDLGLTDENVSEETIIDAMMAHPILINRPLVVTEKGARLCRPQDEVHAIL
nr:arsenate reductase (glutaredoxin) [uncultured Sphingomonas sp.]